MFVDAGSTAKAQMLAAGLASEFQVEPNAYAKIIEGKLALKAKDARQAIKALTDANMLLDTWMGHFDLGRAFLAAGQFLQADSEYDRTLRREPAPAGGARRRNRVAPSRLAPIGRGRIAT